MFRRQQAPRCFVGFFGLNRAMELTYDSIRRNILDPLDSFGCASVLAAHFNCPNVVHSPRSGEFQVPLPRPNVDKMGLELCWLEPQNKANIAEPLGILLKTPLMGEPDRDGIIRTNVLHQLHSLRQLGRLLEILNPDSFDIFCLFRADLLYVDLMPVSEIVQMMMKDKVDLVTPSWHKWGGLNDRFAFCSRRGADVYLNRIDAIRGYCAEHAYFNNERLLLYAAQKAGLNVRLTPMKAKRVRVTGAIKDEDFTADLPALGTPASSPPGVY